VKRQWRGAATDGRNPIVKVVFHSGEEMTTPLRMEKPRPMMELSEDEDSGENEDDNEYDDEESSDERQSSLHEPISPRSE